MVVITSPANQAKLERLRQVNLQISDPRGLTEAQVKGLVAEGKVFCVQSMSLHANEIGGTQMAPELAYDLLSRTTKRRKRILDNVVFIEVPSFNPDGADHGDGLVSRRASGSRGRGQARRGFITSTSGTMTIATRS